MLARFKLLCQTYLQRAFFVGVVLTLLGMNVLPVSGFSSIPVRAASVSLADEKANCSFKKKISIADIIRPAEFVPLIPAACASDGNGGPRPLSLAVLPDILARGFGFLCALVFYLFGFIVLFSGMQMIYGGISESEVTRARKNLQDAVFALVLVFSVYVIINTLLGVLGATVIANTDVSSFFSF